MFDDYAVTQRIQIQKQYNYLNYDFHDKLFVRMISIIDKLNH